jgi:methyl-accepting chemotaxis protein
MAVGKAPKGRFFRLWRRTTDGGKVARSITEEGALWAAHAHAQASTTQAADAAERAVASTAKQRASLDAGTDEARALLSRVDDLQRQVTRLGEAFDRLNVVALNAGLEGARLGEVAGKPLALVSEDVRAQAERGSETSREISKTFADCSRELGAVGTRFDDARGHGADVTQNASVAAAAAADAARALTDLGERLRRATGSDPETAQAVAQATEHARALVTALGTLSGRVPRALLTNALRPVLEPLVRSLFEDDGADSEARPEAKE